MIQTQQATEQAVSNLAIISYLVSLLQLIVIALLGWLIKNTIESKEKLNTINTVLFGPNGSDGLYTQMTKLKAEEESWKLTLQKVVVRLGRIEDKLKINREFNLDDIDKLESM